MIVVIRNFLIFLVDLFFKIFFSCNSKVQFSVNLEKAIGLYKNDGFGSLFAKIRAWDSPYDQINTYIPDKVKITDLGCGDGLLVNFLALSSKERKVYGIEINKSRIEIANKGIPNTTFKQGDILKEKISSSDVYLLVHVFHHLPSYQDQKKLIENITRVSKKGQKIIILEIDSKPLLKYIFSWITDVITVPVLFNQKIFSSKIFYRNRQEWTRLLSKYGYKVRSKRIHKGMPFSHVLFVATRK